MRQGALILGFLAPANLVACSRQDQTDLITPPAPASSLTPESQQIPQPTSTPTPTRIATPFELSPTPTVDLEARLASATPEVVTRPRRPEAIMIPTPQGGPSPAWRRAARLFREANALQFQGRLREAIETYKRSIDSFPTA